MKQRVLNGSEVAEFIQERQRKAVRSLSGAPVLAIVRTNNDPVIDLYLSIKQRYAAVIGAHVEVIQTTEKNAVSDILELNSRKDVHGIIVQLPLANPSHTDELLNSVDPSKDVDGLAKASQFDPATPIAILWLLAAYNIEPRLKRVLIIGQGRLVGAPLARLLSHSGVEVTVADEHTKDLRKLCADAELIVTATGQPKLLTSDMLPDSIIIVDAGTANDSGMVVGDVADDVRARDDITITPIKGGVGPLTVAALFDNLLLAAERQRK